jgi:hypothetical protein
MLAVMKFLVPFNVMPARLGGHIRVVPDVPVDDSCYSLLVRDLPFHLPSRGHGATRAARLARALGFEPRRNHLDDGVQLHLSDAQTVR